MLFGVGVYAVFVLMRGFREIGAQLASFRWEMFGAALALTFCNYVLRFVKWEIFLSRLGIRGIPKIDSFLTFISGFVLTVTPGKVGEVFKSVVLHETHGVAMQRTAPIVVAERLTDVVGIVTLVTVGSMAFPGGAIWAVAGALAVLSLLLVISSQTIASLLFSLVERGPAKVAKLAPRLREAWGSLRTLCSPTALIFPTLLSVGSWALEGMSLWLILGGLGASVQIELALFVYSTSTLAGALIPVPGGLGVTEGSLEQQLTHLGGVAPSAATSAMILIRVATLWFAVLLGFIALGLLRLKFPGMLSDTGTIPPPKPLSLVPTEGASPESASAANDTLDAPQRLS